MKVIDCVVRLALVSTNKIYRFAVMEDTNLTARFTQVEWHTMRLNSSIGGRIVAGLEGLYSVGTRLTIVAEPNDGYIFVNWTSSNGGNFANADTVYTTFTMPSNNTTVTAHFERVYDGTLHLLASLTEEQTGNAMLEGLEVQTRLLYNGYIEFIALNISHEVRRVQFIVALHDVGDRLIDVRIEEALLIPNITQSVTLQMPFPANPEEYSLRVMVWDSYGSDAPYTLMTVMGGD